MRQPTASAHRQEIGRRISEIESHESVASMLRSAEAKPEYPLDKARGFAVYDLDLSAPANTKDSELAGTGRNLEGGYGLLYRKRRSSPGGILEIPTFDLPDFAPGDVIEGFFEQCVVKRSSRSAQVGRAQLLIFTRPDVRLVEPPEVRGLLYDPIDLLGTSSTPTFISVTEDTQPSGASPTGSFSISGARRIRVLMDGRTGGVDATEWDVIWWHREPNSAIWYEVGTERISIPDSAATGYRYRSFLYEVRGNGLLYPEVRNLLAAARTGVGFIVQAVPEVD